MTKIEEKINIPVIRGDSLRNKENNYEQVRSVL